MYISALVCMGGFGTRVKPSRDIRKRREHVGKRETIILPQMLGLGKLKIKYPLNPPQSTSLEGLCSQLSVPLS